MSNIQLQNSNLNAEIGSQEELQGSLTSGKDLQASISSQGNLQASITAQEDMFASLLSKGYLKASVIPQKTLNGKMSSTTIAYIVDSELSSESKNPVQNKVVTEKITDIEAELMNKAPLIDGKVPDDHLPDSIARTADIPAIPKDVSAFNNDVGYLTEHQSLDEYAKKSELPSIPDKVSAFENDVGYLTEHQSLDEYAKKEEIPTIPKDISAFNNDAGYLTEHQSLDEYAKKSELPTVPDKISAFFNDAGYLTEHQSLDEYAKKSELPTVPDKVSAFFNDAGYLTEHQDLSEYAKTIDIPTKVSQLTNDSGYLTQHQDLSAYAKIVDLPTKVSQFVNDAGYLTEHQSLDNYYTKVEISAELDKKQNVIASYVESVNGYIGKVNLNASDIHALPDTTVIPTVPTVISAFMNDADYATRTYVTEIAAGKCKAYTFDTVEELDEWLAVEKNTTDLNNGDVFYIREVGVPDYWWDSQTNSKWILETTKVVLTDYAKIADIPTNISQLANDINFITIAEVDTKLASKQDKISSYVSSVNGKFGVVSLSCDDIGAMPAETVIPTVPTKVSAFTNDAGYLTQHQSLAGYAKTSDLPTKVSQLTNDAGYLTQHQDLSSYAKKSDIPTVPTALSQLSQDSTHRIVTDTEKATWNAKSNFSGKYSDLSGRPTILSASNNGYNGAITAGGDGVAEMGKYIDFHNTADGTSDYSTRFVCTGDYKNTVNLPSVAGTLVVGDKAFKLVTSSSAPSTNDTSIITFVV